MALTTSAASELASPARPLTLAPRSSAIADPSRPVSARGASVGASGLTVTVSLALVGELRLQLGWAAGGASASVKLAVLVGVTVSAARFQAWTSTEVLPAVAVKL